MEIVSINASRLTNATHYTFNESVVALLAKLTAAETAKVAPLKESYLAAFTVEDEAFKISQKSLITDQLAEADAARDQTYMAIKTQISSWMKFNVEEFRAAAVVLNQSLKDYAIDVSMQMDKESGLITNLIQDWEAKYAGQVAKLGIAPMLNLLKEQNEQVKTLAASRREESAGKAGYNLRAARGTTDNAYQAMVKLMNAYMTIGADDSFAAFAAEMNILINHYKVKIMGQKADNSQTSAAGGTTGADTPSGGGGSDTPPSGGDGDGEGEGNNPL